MNDTEAAAIEEAFKQILIGAFMRYYADVDDQGYTKWREGAMTRFRINIERARIARENALKAMESQDEKRQSGNT